MKVTIEKALVTDVFTSDKTGTQFATVQTENGTFKLSARKGGYDLNKLPRIEPMSMRATLHGRIFRRVGRHSKLSIWRSTCWTARRPLKFEIHAKGGNRA